MLPVKIALILIFAAAVAPAQETSYTFNCSKLSVPSAGCTSYNEMITVRDKELMNTLTHQEDTFVCFKPSQDMFFLLSYSTPRYESFVKAGTGSTYEALGPLFFATYKTGVLDEGHMIAGKWVKLSRDAQVPLFQPVSVTETGTISDVEVGIEYQFTNLSHMTTRYSVYVRRSTLRYAETYTWDNPPTSSTKKGPGERTQKDQPTSGRQENSGYCAKFSAPVSN